MPTFCPGPFEQPDTPALEELYAQQDQNEPERVEYPGAATAWPKEWRNHQQNTEALDAYPVKNGLHADHGAIFPRSEMEVTFSDNSYVFSILNSRF